jgi:hypothetical protein
MTPRETAEAIQEMPDNQPVWTHDPDTVGWDGLSPANLSTDHLKELARAYLATLPHEDSFEDTIVAKVLLDLHKNP